MNRKQFIKVSSLAALGTTLNSKAAMPASKAKPQKDVNRKLFIYGGNYHEKFNQFIADLSGKETPKVCFLGTASGDSDRYINGWLQSCENTPIKPYVQRAFINSKNQDKSFAEVFNQMDAIVVGGGNTLNMLAVWKAQGIDLALKEVYEKGTIIAGGSAGSMCWFQDTITDSRPKELSHLKGLGWMEGSHIPHYDTEGKRKPLFHKMLIAGKMKAGYACDEMAGLLFENEALKKAVSMEQNSASYYVSLENGQVIEKRLIS